MHVLSLIYNVSSDHLIYNFLKSQILQIFYLSQNLGENANLGIF